jgi:protein AroM
MKHRIGMVTIGQAPRVDVVPEMADLIGPGVEIVERGALDGLAADTIAGLAPSGDDEILVTRLVDGSAVFLGKSKISPLVQRRIEELEAAGVAMTVLLCTGTFKGLDARRPLIQPDRVLQGVLNGVRFHGRLGVVTPSERHVEQTGARWRSYGFDPVVVASSPYHGDADTARAIEAFRAAGVGFVLLDCMGFRREAREALMQALGVPVVVANLLVARVVAELAGA